MAKGLTNAPKRNLQKMFESMLPSLAGGVLLHCCCAACSTSCMEYLDGKMKIKPTLYYCNPNIDTEAEYDLRAAELARYNREAGYNWDLIKEKYDPSEFYAAVKGLENRKEGGERCVECFKLRLKKAAQKASEEGLKYVMTTLSVSPHKNAELLYEIGKEQAQAFGTVFLPSDFKKGGGFVRGGELCRQYGVYRQNYCGCTFSKPRGEQEN